MVSLYSFISSKGYYNMQLSGLTCVHEFPALGQAIKKKVFSFYSFLFNFILESTSDPTAFIRAA